MGGYGSGRCGGQAIIENGLRLDVNQLVRDGLIRPMASQHSATLIWRDVATGESRSRVGYTSHLEEASGHMRLVYTITRGWSGEKHCLDYTIQLTTTPCRFGGRRWWFVCPLTSRRVSKLYLPVGGQKFFARQAYRIAYRCQRESPRDRALSRAFEARRRLGSHDGIGDYILKPKWMRWQTFGRLMAKVDAAEHVVDWHTAVLVETLMRKTGERLPL